MQDPCLLYVFDVHKVIYKIQKDIMLKVKRDKLLQFLIFTIDYYFKKFTRRTMNCKEVRLENRQPSAKIVGFCLWATKKIFWAVFAYEFELLHNRSFLVKSFAYAHGEIIYSVNCEI